MPAVEENFSRIVRSLLLDVDVHLDQLEHIGYLSKGQRAFLDKFLYKSEDAIRAATLVGGLHGGGALLARLPSTEEGSASCMTPSPSKSDNGVLNATSRVLPRLRSVTEQMKTEDNGLTTFLKRCNARNFSVKVSGTDIEKEPTAKLKSSEYVSTLEPIAEGSAKDSHKVIAKENYDKFLEHGNHDTNMMLHGAKSLTCDVNVESVDYEETAHTLTVASLSLDKTKQAMNEVIGPRIFDDETFFTKALDITAINLEPSNNQQPVAIKNAPTAVGPSMLKCTESQQNNESMDKFKLADADADVTIDQEESGDDDHSGKAGVLGDPATETEEKVETNAWGKPIKPDRTRNKEGAIVGARAKPLGAENRGRAMLEKMGWSKGTGLGKHNSGILEPITHAVKNTKTGLRTSDEKPHRSLLISPSSGGMPNSKSEPKAEGNPVNWNDLSEISVVTNSDWDQHVDNANWDDQPAKLTTKKVNPGANLTSPKMHAEEAKNAEAENTPARPQSIGIKAFYLREGDSPGREKSIGFKTRIQSKDERKTTMHPPGVIIRAMSPQGSHFSKRLDDTTFNVVTGSVLEVLRVHQGDEYHVYNFRSRKRGIVAISLLEMVYEPEAGSADVAPLVNVPAAAITSV